MSDMQFPTWTKTVWAIVVTTATIAGSLASLHFQARGEIHVLRARIERHDEEIAETRTAVEIERAARQASLAAALDRHSTVMEQVLTRLTRLETIMEEERRRRDLEKP